MKTTRQFFCLLSAGLILFSGLSGCDWFKKSVPPNELFVTAENARKDDQVVEAAEAYDQLVQDSPDSELVPEALYYSGISKYTLMLRAPGKQEFKNKKDGLSEMKKTQYAEWLKYLGKQDKAFTYLDAVDKYVYNGTEFSELMERFPSNNLVDDAAFQLTRLEIQTKQMANDLTLDAAVQLYADYAKSYPQSPYREKAAEHLLQLASDQSVAAANLKETAAAFRAFAQAAPNVKNLNDVASALAMTCIAAKDLPSAAALLGVPSVIGIGTVFTEQTSLNIRSGPGMQHRIVGKVDKGAQLLLLGKTDIWYQVRLKDGVIGYARGDYIQVAP